MFSEDLSQSLGYASVKSPPMEETAPRGMRRDRVRVATWMALLTTLALMPGPGFASRAYGQTNLEPLAPEQRAELYQSVANAAAQFERQGQLIRQIVKLVRPTVVHIEARKGDRHQLRVGARRGRIEEAGSGVVIRFGGKYYVLTNLHVIRDSGQADITIKLHDGRKLHPTSILSDNGTDVAIMGIVAPGLIEARLGDSGRMAIGDFVLAVGSPFGLTHSVTYGIVSAKSRHDLELGKESGITFQDFIQTDAAINPGNSGGPLINLRGEVIGINTAIASESGGNEGVAFAIPINMVKLVAEQLIQHGKLDRGYLGVKLDSTFSSSRAAELGLSHLRGTRISNVTTGSPADRAHLQVDDVILSFNGVPIIDDNHLVNTVGLTGVGKQVSVVVFRDGAPLTLQVKVSAWSQP
jgi:serine protease Do